MAQTIPGFTDAESAQIMSAAEAGMLTTEQKRLIARIVEKNSRDALIPRSAEDVTAGAVTRERAEGLGGTLGGIAGAVGGGALAAPTGPGAAVAATAGAAGGAVLGASIGSAAFDNLNNFLDFIGAIQKPEATTRDTAMRALEAGVEEAKFALGGEVVGAGFRAIKPGIGAIFGVRNEEALDLVKKAQQAGLVIETPAGRVAAVGAVDVGQGVAGGVPRMLQAVLGVVPFIGGGARAASRQKAEAAVTRINELLVNMAPVSVMANDLGVDMMRAVKGARKEFVDTSARLYDNFRSLSMKAPGFIPTRAIREYAEQQRTLLNAKRIKLKPDAKGKVEELSGVDDVFGEFVAKLERLPDHLTVAQHEGLIQDLRRLADDGYDIKRLVDAKTALEEGMNAPNFDLIPAADAGAIREAHIAANQFFFKNITQFQTPTAQRFTRADKNVFRAGPEIPGTINDDELLRVVTNLRSPQAIKDLRLLVGDEQLGRVARSHFETAWEQARVYDKTGALVGLDVGVIRKSLGLGAEGTVSRGATEELLNSAGIPIETMENLIDVVGSLTRTKDVSTFLARRTTLGGLKSGLSGAVGGGFLQGGIGASVSTLLGLRYLGSLISSPRHLTALMRAAEPTTSQQLRDQLMGRVVNYLITREGEDSVIQTTPPEGR